MVSGVTVELAIDEITKLTTVYIEQLHVLGIVINSQILASELWKRSIIDPYFLVVETEAQKGEEL